MLWARFDCQSPSNPKLVRAGAEAAWLWHASICYSNLHQLDGRIAKDLLALLYHPLAKKADKLAVKLCELRLWHDRGDHFEIHDYAVFQEEALKSEMELKREAKREYERERKRVQRHPVSQAPVPDNDASDSGTNLEDNPGHPSCAHAPTPAGAVGRVGSSSADSSFDLKSEEPQNSNSIDAPMWRVYNRWREVWGKGKGTEFTKKRKHVVRERLKRYPLSDLIDAIEGAHMSPHHLGQNDRGEVFDDLELHLRSDEHLEKHRDRKRRGGNQAPRLNGSSITPAARAASPEDYEADNHNGWPG